jgi:hypothetical protein
MKQYSAQASVRRHPEITNRPLQLRDLAGRFGGTPRDSVTSLLIEMGPFEPARDAFRFTNSFQTTVDQATDFIELVPKLLVQEVIDLGALGYRDALKAIRIPVPALPDIPLPAALFSSVIDTVLLELTARLADKFLDPLNLSFGRCGGMAFAGYDFYLQGWDVSGFADPPTEGVLGEYIYDRLLDSIKDNIGKFLEWTMIVHVLPHVDEIATAALLAAAGSFAAPVGPFIGALIGSKVDIFDLGGPQKLLEPTKKEWEKIKDRLDAEAAAPIGLVFKDKSLLWEQHQVLAVGYTDNGLGRGTLNIWDNKGQHNNGNVGETLNLDFRGKELAVTSTFASSDNRQLAGIFLERYERHRPPLSLKVP